MTDNIIREQGAKAMSEMLKVNTTLTSLDMRCKEGKDWEKMKKREEVSRLNDRQ